MFWGSFSSLETRVLNAKNCGRNGPVYVENLRKLYGRGLSNPGLSNGSTWLILSRSVREIKRNVYKKFRNHRIAPKLFDGAPKIHLNPHDYLWSFSSAGDYLTR